MLKLLQLCSVTPRITSAITARPQILFQPKNILLSNFQPRLFTRAFSTDYIINEKITDRQVRLIGVNGEKIGVVSISSARDSARKNKVDLVKISPAKDDQPAVCRLIELGKLKYEQSKKSKSTGSKVKEVQFGISIAKHDLDFKMQNIVRFLTKENHQVKVLLKFKKKDTLDWKAIQELMAVVANTTQGIGIMTGNISRALSGISVLISKGAKGPQVPTDTATYEKLKQAHEKELELLELKRLGKLPPDQQQLVNDIDDFDDDADNDDDDEPKPKREKEEKAKPKPQQFKKK